MYEKNLKSLKKLFPKIALKLETENVSTDEIEIIKTKDNNITLKTNGKLLHSRYKPIEEAKKVIKKSDIKDKDIILLLGLGLGYYLDILIKEKTENCRIFVVEDSLEVYKLFLEKKDFARYIENNDVYFFHTSQIYDFEYKIEDSMKLGLTPDYEIISNKAAYSLAEDRYFKFIEIFKNCISSILINTSTIFGFSKMWHKNSFKNLKHFVNSYGVNTLFNRFKNVPVIVIASGPSLEKNIKYLHWAKGKAIIIAVGTVLKKLLNENIKPDFIVTMDGGEPNWEHFRRINYSEYPIIYEPMVSPKILDKHKGDKFVFVSSSIVGSWGELVFEKKGFMKMGGSVALTGYDFGVRIGGDPIILIGQDLAYTGGKTHVSGTHYEKDTVDERAEDLHQFKIDDIYGGKILSDRKFLTFIEYFQRFIHNDKLDNPDLKVFDCTEGGAKIRYTEIKTFKDIYFNYIDKCSVDVQKEIQNIKENHKLAKNQDFNNAINDIKSKLEKVLKKSKEGIKISNSLLKKSDKKNYRKLDEIDKEINSEIEVANLIRLITQQVLAKTIKKPKEELTEKDILKKNKNLYEGIKEGVEFNLKCLEEINEKKNISC